MLNATVQYTQFCFCLFHYDLPLAKFQQTVITGSEYISTPVYHFLQMKRDIHFNFCLRKNSFQTSHIKPSEHDQHINVSPLSTSAFDGFYGIFGIS